MRDWMAEALALTAPLPLQNMEGYTDKKDIEDKTERFGTSVPFVRPPLHPQDAWETARIAPPETELREPDPPPTPYGAGEPGNWRRQLFRLRADSAPCAGFQHWPSVHREAMQFLHDRGAEAEQLGWTALDLFGVHHQVGAIRSDCTGALLTLSGKRVVDLTPFLIRFVDGLAYRRRPLLAGLVVPVWQFGAAQ